jgi:hypothetical protein
MQPQVKSSAIRCLKEYKAVRFLFPAKWFCSEPVTYLVRITDDGKYKHLWVSKSGRLKWGPFLMTTTDTMLFVVRNRHRWVDWE